MLTLWHGAGLALAAVLLFWVLGAYNRLVALRGAIGSAWQQCDGAVKQRSSALLELVHVLRGVMEHEHATLDALLVASTQVDAAAHALRQRPVRASLAADFAKAEAALAASLTRTQALIAQRPELGAHVELQPLLQALQQAESQLAFGRQLFNLAVQQFNSAALQIPTRLVARVFGLELAGAV